MHPHQGGQVTRPVDAVTDMIQQNVLFLMTRTPQRQWRRARIQRPQQRAGVGAGAVAAFGELGAEGGAVGGLAGLASFLEAEDPVGHVLAAAAAAHEAIPPGVVDDEHGDGAVPQGEQPVADGIEGVVVVFRHAELGGGEVINDEEAAVLEIPVQPGLPDGASDVDAAAVGLKKQLVAEEVKIRR